MLTLLKKDVDSNPALHHPFLKEFSKGNLRLGQIQTFALQHYQLVRIFTSYLENLILRFENDEVREIIALILQDEYAHPNSVENSHPALYRRFMRSLSLSENDWDSTTRFDETTHFICRHIEMTKLLQPEIGIGAIGPAHEYSIPIMFSYLVEGLRKFGLKDAELTYFILHIEQDKLHAQLMDRAISIIASNSEARDLVRKGIQHSLQLRYKFWSKLWSAPQKLDKKMCRIVAVAELSKPLHPALNCFYRCLAHKTIVAPLGLKYCLKNRLCFRKETELKASSKLG